MSKNLLGSIFSFSSLHTWKLKCQASPQCHLNHSLAQCWILPSNSPWSYVEWCNVHGWKCSGKVEIFYFVLCWVQVDVCMDLVLDSFPGHLLHWKLLPVVLKFLENFADLLTMFGIRYFSRFCCYVCGSSPTLATNIMSLASLLATTAGTNIIKTACKVTHMVYCTCLQR